MSLGDKTTRAALKHLMDDPGWDVLKEKLAMHIAGLNDQEVTGNDAFQTLRALHKKEGGVEQLKEFFDKVEKLNFED